jgi:transposase
MRTNIYQPDFTGQKIYIGIDVHKKSWKVTIRTNFMELKTFSMNPSVDELVQHLRHNYANAQYYSVYESGFCGFWIDKELRKQGINNIIVNAADVPETNKERIFKSDSVDCRKLSRELEKGSLRAIYVPDDYQEALRCLCRLRYTLTKEQVRIKTRIKSFCLYYGKELPVNGQQNNWSGNFIRTLENISFSNIEAKESLNLLIDELKNKKIKIALITKQLLQSTKQSEAYQTIKRLCSIPGISFITAVTIFTEIMDISRFKRLDDLCSFVGIVPATASSGERRKTLGLTNRQSKYLRYLLLEASWVAIRHDPALTSKFGDLTKKMAKQKAIIRIAKKLLSRIRCIWMNNIDYVKGVVK